ncbi:MAG TPA: polyhydroxyalkanoic acid system family protein [Mucilaginibacter sp.]|jgi:hypothetical protein|nr:polyhydroxyalkanoic acid system family protein [Mucilaginibacter sp.]
MPTLEMTIPHSLPQQEALQRIKKLLSETKRDHGDKIQDLAETWNGNEGNFSFKAQGYDISGTLTVNPSSVELKGKIPFAVSLFKGRITRMINEKAAELLGA